MILNDDSDTITGSPDQYSWERGTNCLQSRPFTAAEKHQSNSNGKSQKAKSQTSDKVKKPLSSSQFITGSKARVTNYTSSSVGDSRSNENTRRILHPLPPPPPTPGADDFEMTGRAGSAKRACNETWNEELLDNGTTERIAQRQKWSSSSHEFLPDVLEKEDWDILPVFTKPRQRTNTSKSNQPSSKNLQSMLSSTTLEPLVMKEKTCLEEESVPAIDDDFSSGRCEQQR